MTALDRRAVVRELVADRGDMLVIGGLGGTTWDLADADEHPLTFGTWGGMGNAAMLGLGLALAQPDRPVLVVTGDGEMLMGIGALATVAVQAPSNLSIAVIDNELYGETGRQPTHTGHGVDLAGMAKAAGIEDAETITDAAGVTALRKRLTEPGLRFACIKVGPENGPMVLPERDGITIKTRFRQALLSD
ncbi:MAG: thiamine pyrophosphate-dependent enzyme [Alphaproteobacteria bacterium]|jgi:thiamine pyrophosphate-dependent acetolactate synthase large subunit-like protein|nr:thiamine pyrophosphate-dependent enzyme [Alphaproteobacteria bacterium]